MNANGNDWTTADFSMEHLLEVANAMELVRPTHDVIVTTDDVFRAICKYANEQRGPEAEPTYSGSLLGVPIETYPTKVEAVERHWRLKEKGKRPMLVLE